MTNKTEDPSVLAAGIGYLNGNTPKLSKAGPRDGRGPKGPGPKQLAQKVQESQKERTQGPRKAQKETQFWNALEKIMTMMTMTANFGS